VLRKKRVILGIDEAGRGPVIGPLVLCGVWLTPAAERALCAEGVKDSKAFGSGAPARARRNDLAAAIRQRAACVTLMVVEAAEVDRRVGCNELNVLERELAAAIIHDGPTARRIVADGRRLFGPLAHDFPQLEAVDRAESACTAVAAASIVAKVERDARYQAIIEPLEQELGQAIRGGGYVNRGTEAFLRSYVARFGALPDEVRQSWSWSVLEELGRSPTAGLPLFAATRGKHKDDVR
jgi:ribonuclease HII